MGRRLGDGETVEVMTKVATSIYGLAVGAGTQILTKPRQFHTRSNRLIS